MSPHNRPVLLSLVLSGLLAAPGLAAPAATDLYLATPIVDRAEPFPLPGLVDDLIGPLPFDQRIDGLAAVHLTGSERPELLLFRGAEITWLDLDASTVGILSPAPPGLVEHLVGVDFGGSPRPDLVAIVDNRPWFLDFDRLPWRWRRTPVLPFVPDALAAADVLPDPGEELVAATDGVLRVLRPRIDRGSWDFLEGPPRAPARVDSVFLGMGGMPFEPASSAKVLTASWGAKMWIFQRDATGAATWSGPFLRRFKVRASAPLDLRAPEPPPVGTFVLPKPLHRGKLRFTDLARVPGSGLEAPLLPGGDGHCPGAVFTDLDGDSFPDLYLVRGFGAGGDSTNRLYLGDGAGGFEEVAEDLGAADPGNGAGALAFDYDNDGDQDLLIINYDGPNVLLERRGSRWVDVTAGTDPSPGDLPGDRQEGLAFGISFDACEPGEPTPCRLDDSLAAAAGDFNRDGFLDVYVGNHLCCGFPQGERDILYLNRGNGTFKDITVASGAGADSPLAGQPSTQAVVVADFNNDLWPDIYVAVKDSGPTRDRLLLNRGDHDKDGVWDGTFREWFGSQPEPLGWVTGAAMGVAVGDYDNDGDLDVFLTDVGEMDFYRNRLKEDSHFGLELVDPNPLASPRFSWGTGWTDFDNDGDLDLHVATNGGLMDWLHRNDGGTRFTDVALSAGVGLAWDSRASLAADLDRDGRQDLLVVNRGEQPVALLRNRTANGNHWLEVTLEGRSGGAGPFRSSRQAVGARLLATTGDLVQRRDVLVGGSTCASTADLTVSFGLGAESVVDRLLVLWPSGQRTTLRNVAADQHLVLQEP